MLFSPALILTAIVVIYLLMSINILAEYERGVIFRLGKLLPQPKGPGVILVFAPLDRIVRLDFGSQTLVAQLTGRTADLFLLDESNQIEGVLRTQIQGIYLPPPAREIRVEEDLPEVAGSPSENSISPRSSTG